MSQFQRRPSMIRRGSGNNGQKTPHQNIVAFISEYHFADPKQSNPDKDWAEVYLMHDVPDWGLKAEFDDQGVPQTKVKVTMPMPADGKGDRRRDLRGLSMKKSGGPAMLANSYVAFEKCFQDKDGGIRAYYSKGGATAEDQQNQLKIPFTNFYICVLPERRKKEEKDGKIEYKPSGRQTVLIANWGGAVPVRSEAEINQTVAEILASNGIGTPGFQVLCRRIGPAGATAEQRTEIAADPNSRLGHYTVALPKAQGEGENRQWVALTAEEAVAKFWETAPEGMRELVGNPEWALEVVPVYSVHQVRSLVPSENEKGRDNSKMFRIFEEKSQGVYDVADYGWALGHAFVERMAADSDYWYSTYQTIASSGAKMFSLHDIPTVNMDEFHTAAVYAEAERLAANKDAFYKAQKDKEAAPAAGGPTP